MTHEEVREEAADCLCRFWESTALAVQPESYQNEFRELVDALFALRYENGQPMIAALAKDQDSPLECHYGRTLGDSWHNQENRLIHQVYLEAGFRRIVEKISSPATSRRDASEAVPEVPGETTKQRAIYAYLQGKERKDWTSPTTIGHDVGGGIRHSSWASPICLRMVRSGLLERSGGGWYRIAEKSE